MDDSEALARLAAARVAVLATVRTDGSPHLVPVAFAALGHTLVSAVDHKPKTTSRLQRLVNIEGNPRVSLLAHDYSEDWSTLWWVRADGSARVIAGGPDHRSAISALRAKYRQYRERPPAGPVIEITVDATVSWTASP
jgi:PPOX class probable F420-dependent enzyme